MPDSDVTLIFIGLAFMTVAIGFLFYLKPHVEIGGQKIGFSEIEGVNDRPSAGCLGTLFITVLFGLGAAAAIVGIVSAAIPAARDIQAVLGDNRDAIEDRVTPVPTPTPVDPSAIELFSLAFTADELGNSDEAIKLYSSAIEAGLEPTRRELSHIQIGLLELLEIEDNPDDPLIETRCDSVESNLEAAEMTSLLEHEELVNDLRDLLSGSVCTTASVSPSPSPDVASPG